MSQPVSLGLGRSLVQWIWSITRYGDFWEEEEGESSRPTEHAAATLWIHDAGGELRAHAADFPGPADVAAVVDGNGPDRAGVFARVDVAEVPDAGAPFVDGDCEERGL